MAIDINLNDVAGLKVQTAAEWAVDSTVYSSQFILITSDVFFTGTDDIPMFKIADGTRTWAQLEYFPDPNALAAGTLQGANDYTDTEIAQEVIDRNAAINSALEGLKWKQSVRLASTSNLALPVGAQTIDGVLSVIGDRILLKDQSSAAQNGIYICNSGGWTRALDASTGVELQGAVVSVDEGVTNADTTWRQTTDNITLGSSSVVWVSFGATVPNASTTTRGIAKLYTSSGSNTDGSMDQNSITAYADGKVIDSIADGDTSHAPSRNTVFDALSTKENIVSGVTASGINTYTITTTSPSTYTVGEKFLVLFTNSNTGSATLNRNGLGALALTKKGLIPLVAGDIQAGSWKMVAYDGTRYQIVDSPNEYVWIQAMITRDAVSPIDSTTYYSGPFPAIPSTTEGLMQFPLPTGTIEEAYITTMPGGSVGNSENIPWYLRQDKTTDHIITLVNTISQGGSITKGTLYTGLSIATSITSLYEIKIPFPAFAANPTAVRFGVWFKLRLA